MKKNCKSSSMKSFLYGGAKGSPGRIGRDHVTRFGMPGDLESGKTSQEKQYFKGNLEIGKGRIVR